MSACLRREEYRGSGGKGAYGNGGKGGKLGVFGQERRSAAAKKEVGDEKKEVGDGLLIALELC